MSASDSRNAYRSPAARKAPNARSRSSASRAPLVAGSTCSPASARRVPSVATSARVLVASGSAVRRTSSARSASACGASQSEISVPTVGSSTVSLRSTPAARRSLGMTMRAPAPVRRYVYVSRTSSTIPVSPSNVTWSPMRSGWVTASSRPATALASVVREAKPTTAATMARDARNGATSFSSELTCESAMATPMRTIVTSATRRRKRRRVSASGVSAPPARRAATAAARRDSARSRAKTAPSVTASAIAAVIHWSLSDHQDAKRRMAPWIGMERDRSVALRGRPMAALPRARLSREAAAGLRLAWRAALLTRVLVWVAGVGALLVWGNSARAHDFDPLGVTAPFGAVGDAVVAPAARWDSVWSLAIARDGYGAAGRPAFFPLYPLLARAGGWVVGSPLVAGALVSIACLVVGLAALYELTRLELGGEAARWTVVALAASPMSFFFSAVYSESLFLALSAGALLAARRGRWWWAGALGALAAATRSAGVVLLVPLVLLAWSARPRPRAR